MTDQRTDGWATVLEEMDAMAAQLEASGWRTVAVAAGESAAVTAETSHTDRHGFAHVIPGNKADEFEEVFVPDGFPVTEVYRAGTSTNVYLVTVLKDPPTETAVLIAGALDRDRLPACERAATAAGRMYTDVLAVDGTCLGTFEHEDPAPFFAESRSSD